MFISFCMRKKFRQSVSDLTAITSFLIDEPAKSRDAVNALPWFPDRDSNWFTQRKGANCYAFSINDYERVGIVPMGSDVVKARAFFKAAAQKGKGKSTRDMSLAYMKADGLKKTRLAFKDITDLNLVIFFMGITTQRELALHRCAYNDHHFVTLRKWRDGQGNIRPVFCDKMGDWAPSVICFADTEEAPSRVISKLHRQGYGHYVGAYSKK